AHDTMASIEQGRWLWNQVGRQNLMIKIPGTTAGLTAIEQLIFEGVNINVTLLFSVERYTQVLEAYMLGLERRVRERAAIDKVASVASFFLSRIDTMVDAELEKMGVGQDLHGRAAIACAKAAYAAFESTLSGQRWQALQAAGAQAQKLLWASTSTKNPAFSDILYVENLIGPQTVNTLPPKTLDAYRDHGRPAVRINDDADAWRQSLSQIEDKGISIANAAELLEREGLDKFSKSFDALMHSLENERRQLKRA
ncbi:MAG: transaldolase, partial [Gammaproteobacteria bacterium]|nr:transaldolase [Gammaproteobacteria bacterium]